jgi:hypothetical protein
MAANRFCRYELRTKNEGAARAFYAEVLGPDFWDLHVTLAPLPAAAAARGAPPHWLGFLGVSDVEGTAQQLVELGAQRRDSNGSRYAALRDPFGAGVALSSELPPPEHPKVAWHALHTQDGARAFALYTSLFGWTAAGAADFGLELGPQQLFAWDDSGRSAGSIGSGARSAQVHPQWLFCFAVPDLEAALARVRSLGGRALPPMRTERGDRVAGCEDAQCAAFGLYQAANG